LASRCEAVEIEQGSAVDDNVADFDYSTEANQVLVIDFVLPKQLGIVTEVTQKPVKFPQRSGRAIEAASN
jgi:hypothetical protein